MRVGGSLWDEISLNQKGKIFFKLKFYFQDTERMDKVSRRINQLQEINNNIKLLNEMLAHYSKEVSSQSDRDMMKVSNVYFEDGRFCALCLTNHLIGA